MNPTTNPEEILGGLVLELRRGTIVLSTLALLAKPVYGYSLVQELTQSGIPVEANTLYPLLRRLEKQGLLESRWETDGPKPRKYYAATAFGLEVLEALKGHWQAAAQNMNAILEEEPS